MILEKIEALCKEQEKTIARLEKEAGLGNGTVRNWDKTKPNLANLEAVAKVLGVRTVDLMD